MMKMFAEATRSRYAALRVHVRKMQEPIRIDHDDLRAREAQGEVPEVQRLEDRATAQRLHGADIEKELKASAEEPVMRWLTLVGYLWAALLMLGGAIAAVVSAEPIRFLTVAPGIEHATFEGRSGGGESFSGHAFKVDLEVAELRLVPAAGASSRRTVDDIVAPYPAAVAINASFFDIDGRAMGLAVDGGRLMVRDRRQSWGALVVNDRKARIVLGADVKDPLAHRLVVQGIPRLVVGGKVQQLKPQFAERTAVCAQASVVMLVVSTKAETTAFARFLAETLDKGGLGCLDALNLDGGPSTQLVVKLPTLAFSLPGGWGVPNALVVTPGKKSW